MKDGEIVKRAVFFKHLEPVKANPAGFADLHFLEFRTLEITLDFYQKVEFTSLQAIRLPLENVKQGAEVGESPARLLADFASERLRERFPSFDVSTGDVPAAWKEPPVFGAFLHEYPAMNVLNQRAYGADLTRRFGLFCICWSRSSSVVFTG